jgi:Holliday junction DNA helicase RuvB
MVDMARIHSGYQSTDRKGDGGLLRVKAIAAAMGHERDTLEDVVEPYLLQLGFVIRTPRGRVARPAAYEHLGLTGPKRAADEPTLFE